MSDLTCYTIGDNVVSSSNQYFPCGKSNFTGATAQNCCYGGDYCMEDGICKYTHYVLNGTGYYMGACTDPTWQDPACRKQCTSEYGQDITYDLTTDTWHCCDVTLTAKICNPPSNFLVIAPGPNLLETIKHVTTPAPSPALVTAVGSITSLGATFSSTPSSTSSTSSSSTITSSSTTLSASSSSSTTAGSATSVSTANSSQDSSSNSNGLSGGADAGIAVGVIAGVLLLAGLGFFLWRRQRRQNREWTAKEEEHQPDTAITASPGMSQVASAQHQGNFVPYGGTAPQFGGGYAAHYAEAQPKDQAPLPELGGDGIGSEAGFTRDSSSDETKSPGVSPQSMQQPRIGELSAQDDMGAHELPGDRMDPRSLVFGAE